MSTLKAVTLQADTWQNNAGDREYYKCQAWVNFDGTGTVAIRASGNVSSITDNGVGDYTINMTNALVDSSYAFVCNVGDGNTTSVSIASAFWTSLPTSSANRIRLTNGSVAADSVYVTASVFR